MTQDSKIILNQILNQVRSLQSQDQNCLLVFDLDSTLFDVTPRIQKIIQDFANDKKHQDKYPESCKILKTIEVLQTDWGIKDSLIRAGLDSHHPDFHESLRQYWGKAFFSNDYLKYDVPYEGAVNFVQQLYQTGAHIAYLTGRDVARMGIGSIDVLKQWSFPVNEPKAELILKPEKGMDDAQFKTDYFAALPENQFAKIWFFENEPLNVNLVRDDHNHVEIVFFDSTHSGQAHPPGDLPKIMHYLLD